MDALLLVDTTREHLPSPLPQPLVDLVARARGVGGVIVHVADRAVDDGAAGEGSADGAEGSDESAGSADGGADAGGVAEEHDGQAGEPDDAEDVDVQPQIDSVLGTTEDELVLVSAAPDAFEGVEDLADGLDDLGVDRIIVAGSNARGAVLESAAAALAIGFELTVVADGIVEPGEWIADLEAAGAVVKSGADVWLKM
ncbi:isochorismatase family protein [Brevibacterium jeotgali]|uniref:Nicotinamidase-related amidase n=1 Tax=Brevibacterium jeotgali TaxID=1262550 RepID=A0A2H1L6S9_9MICO|nr:isochorismatase family protein [Brevibacterium jeotgali]TWB98466.1 nicotinamidase-related amidase [Brevibacterium jeotgali]SMY12083.1 Nicotinamidase-related amidase [Brevibacterium jeotgali]